MSLALRNDRIYIPIESILTIMMKQPILYSFRRCPYAMRARMAVLASQQTVEIREILLKQKPQSMLAVSPKGTVPVLVLPNGKVIEESLEIMFWALAESDPSNWYHQLDETKQAQIQELVEINDNQFKPLLDRYKYSARFPENSEEEYRRQCQFFLALLDKNLRTKKYLLQDSVSLADIAIFPFIRQFAYVNLDWFEASEYENLKKWFNSFLKCGTFNAVMNKLSPWQFGDQAIFYPSICDEVNG